jgi:tripartite-type tricarboxylate transporter receptor subunit TctC
MGQGHHDGRREGGTMKRTLVGVIGVLVFAVASAQSWPSRPIRYIVPFPPGAFNDTLARTLAAELPKTLGQPVVVENRPGGNTIIGTEFAAKSPPDGYTLFGAALPFSVIQSLYRTSFDVTKDFAPITLAGITPNLLVAHPGAPVNSVKELIAYAKANPGRLNYASTGNGTSNHLSFELFKAMTQTDVTHVPYKGSAPAVTDLIAGQIQVMFDNTPNVLPHVRAGKLKALAVSTKGRTPYAPEVPSVEEAGVPGYDVSVWFGVLTVAGTSREIVNRLNSEMVKTLTSVETKERFGKMGVDVVAGTPEHFSAFLKSEVERWGKVVRDAGIKAD